MTESLIHKSRLPVNEILGPKGGAPIVGLTAYTAPVAKRLDRHVDFMLVGDSLAMVLYGMTTTRDIDLETMIRHGRAVARSAVHVPPLSSTCHLVRTKTT